MTTRTARLLLLGALALAGCDSDAGGGRHHASLDPDTILAPGPHSLTVVLTTPEGEVSTSTALYSVEG